MAKSRVVVAVLMAFVLSCAVVFASSGTALADTITVGPTCSLDTAVRAANNDVAEGGCAAGDGDDIIVLPTETTLTLSQTVDIASNVTIVGNNTTIDFGAEHANLRVSGGVVEINNVRITRDSGTLVSVLGGSVTIRQAVIQAGNNSGVSDPIGIDHVGGSLTVIDSLFSPSYFWDGIAIRTNATTSLRSVDVTGWGVGVDAGFGANVRVDNSTFWFNQVGVRSTSEIAINHATIIGGDIGVQTYGPGGVELTQPVLTTHLLGGQKVGNNFQVGSEGSIGNAWPATESPERAIDDRVDKHLNFGVINTGLLVTGTGSSTITELRIRTANDFAERDPASFELWGSSVVPAAGQTDFSLDDFTLIADGPLDLTDDRDSWGGPGGNTVAFLNQALFRTYIVIFPTVKGNANSMQIAELQLFQPAHGIVRASLLANDQADCSGRISADSTSVTSGACNEAVIETDAGTSVIQVPRLGFCTAYSDSCGSYIVPLAGRVAIDADATCSVGLPTDARGLPRPVGGGCDAGANELQQAPIMDGDGDSVPDADDRCLTTPAGLTVTIEGCAPSEFSCNAKPGTILGTAGDDTLSGTSGDDVIIGLEGIDKVDGLGGDDTICGNDGDDVVAGGLGKDHVLGGDGLDTINGGPGDDMIFGEAGADMMHGGDGADTIDGGVGSDTINGGLGDDQLIGDDGSDIMNGGQGTDFMYGGAGDDEMTGAEGNDRIRGQMGADTITGNDGNDFLYGGVDADTISGNDGNDTIGGFGGTDTIHGGAGNDTVFGGFGGDIINGGDGDDELRGLIGNDTIHGDAGNDKIFGDNGQDQIFGDLGNDTLQGGNSLDTLSGGPGDDNVSGGKASDTLSGGTGVDICAGNLGVDTADATCETQFGIP